MRGMLWRKTRFGLRYAWRDLSGDPKGFTIFILCIIIGVAALSCVSGLSFSLSQGLSQEGRVILGGDISLSLMSRQLTDDQRTFLTAHGKVSDVYVLRAMARRDNDDAAVIEIKAVDTTTYPSFGVVTLSPNMALADALKEINGVAGAAVDPLLLTRLNIKLGETIMIGNAKIELRAILENEPDKLAAGLGLGPRVLISLNALESSGLQTPGAIIRHLTRLTLDGPATNDDVKTLQYQLANIFPQAGWDIRSRDAISPQFTRNLDRFTQLLTLVALTALVAGGAGVANAVNAFVENKLKQHAILKVLGLSGAHVFLIALTEILLASFVAIGCGLMIGALLPFIAAPALRQVTGLPFIQSFNSPGLAIGALYGLLVTCIFSFIPLGRIHETPVSCLLRDQPAFTKYFRYRSLTLIAVLFLLGLVINFAADLRLGLGFIFAVSLALGILFIASKLLMLAFRTLPHPKNPSLRLAFANIWRPKSLAPAILISIGLTQTLILTLIIVENSLHHELERADLGEIPNFYFLDVPKDKVNNFQDLLISQETSAHIQHAPMMRGRFIEIKGEAVERRAIADDAKWVLEGDRGITFSTTVPSNSKLIEGDWWPENYNGPPLVSLEKKTAEGFGLSLGDTIKVNVMGRLIVATVANFRKVDWRSYAINFVMVFSPNSFKTAPYNELFTISFDARSTDERNLKDANLTREIAKKFPSVVTIHVRETLASVDKIISQLALAARGATSIAILTAGLALASAILSSHRLRRYDAVILKIIGATRRWLTYAYGIEFTLLSIIATLIALLAAACAAYAMTKYLMKIDFIFPLLAVGGCMLLTIIATSALGLMLTMRILSGSPARQLRNL